VPTLRAVLGLPEGGEPSLVPASIKDMKVKLWGPYPALVPSPGATVRGSVYLVEGGKAQEERLANYETHHYAAFPVTITLEDGSGAEVAGKTFVWALGEEALKDGEFDLGEYARRRAW